MNKTVLIISICIIVAFSAVALILVLTGRNNEAVENNEPEENVGMEDVVTQKETALKIGRALLEERFPDSFSKGDEILDAMENDGVWTVYKVVERQGLTEDGTPWILFGGVLSVEFRKSTGEVLRIGVND